MVRINLAPDAFLARFRDIVRFERGGGVDAVGRFSVPAVVADLDGYVLPAAGRASISPGCALDDCDINLSAAQIARAARRRRARPRRPGAADAGRPAGAGRVRRRLSTPRQRGAGDLPRLRAGLRAARGERPAAAPVDRAATRSRRRSPSYLDRYPAAPLPAGGEEFFYWSVMSFGMKPITRANHVVVMPVTTDGLAGFVAASRTLYASHYFRDGLEVKYVVPGLAGAHRLLPAQRQPLAQRVAPRPEGAAARRQDPQLGAQRRRAPRASREESGGASGAMRGRGHCPRPRLDQLRLIRLVRPVVASAVPVRDAVSRGECR